MPRKKDFDLKVVEGLGRIGATREEMATVLRCSVSTIDDRLRGRSHFAKAYKKGRDEGKVTLRRKQWDLAMSGDRTMQIWLGKQMLDQKDNSKHEVGGKGGGLVELTVRWPESGSGKKGKK